MDRSEGEQIRRGRKCRLIPLHDESAVKQPERAISCVQDADLVAHTLNSSVEQATPVGEPRAPCRAALDTRRQVARFTALQREQVDFARAAPRIAPPS